MSRSQRIAGIATGLTFALWLMLTMSSAGYADDCGRYLKNPTNLATIPRSLIEDCMRTGYGQAIATAVVAGVAGGAISVAAGQAISRTIAQVAAEQATRSGAGSGNGGGSSTADPTSRREPRRGGGSPGSDSPREPATSGRRGAGRRKDEGSGTGTPIDDSPIGSGDGTKRSGVDTADDLPPGGEKKGEKEEDGERKKRDGKKPGEKERELTPEEQKDIKDRFRELIQKSRDAQDPNTAFVIQRTLRNIPRDANGVPVVDIDKLEKTVDNVMSKPPSVANEVLEQSKDFVKGVGKDVKDLGVAAGGAIKDAAVATGQAVKDYATDSKFRDKVWHGIVKTTDDIGSAIAKSGRDLAHGTIELINTLGDKEFRKDFVSGVKEDVANLPDILGETIAQSAEDLQDAKKVEDAFRRGVPGGGKILDAMDHSRLVTDRFPDAVAGAAEWAGAAETLQGGLALREAAEAGVKGLGREAAGEAAEAGAKGALGREAASEAAEAGARGALGREAREEAAEGLAGGGAREGAGSGADDLARQGDRQYKPANLTPKQLDDALAGMPDANQRHVQMVADKYGVEVQVRPTNPDAKELLEKGVGQPKPEAIKTKTLTDEDMALGARDLGLTDADKGKVGFFEPKLPQGVNSVDDLPPNLRNRYNQRQQEFVDRQAEIQRMQTNPDVSHREPLIEVKNGIVYDKASGKPFCGDHDLFDIRGVNGEELPAAVRAQVNKDLQGIPAQTQHGEHMGWDYSGKSRVAPEPIVDPANGKTIQPRSDFEKAQAIDQKILQGHGPPVYDDAGKLQSGGEPLITFRANEATGPVRDKLEGSYFTGERPVHLSPEDKFHLRSRFGLDPADVDKMPPDSLHQLLTEARSPRPQ